MSKNKLLKLSQWHTISLKGASHLFIYSFDFHLTRKIPLRLQILFCRGVLAVHKRPIVRVFNGRGKLEYSEDADTERRCQLHTERGSNPGRRTNSSTRPPKFVSIYYIHHLKTLSWLWASLISGLINTVSGFVSTTLIPVIKIQLIDV